MKIALLLTGQLRSWKLCGHIVKNSILNLYDTDVFMSVDLNNTLQHEGENLFEQSTSKEVEEAIQFYKPKKVFIGTGYTENLYEIIKAQTVSCLVSPCPKVELKNSEYIISSFSMNCETYSEPLIKQNLKVIFEQYYYVQKAYDMLEQQMMETDTAYDLIIRLRFDQLIWTDEFYNKFETNQKGVLFNNTNMSRAEEEHKPINLDKPNKDEIYVFGCGIHYNYVYVNDQFWIHDKSMISHMKSFYHSLPVIIDECSNSYSSFGATIEHLFAIYLKHKTIKRSNVNGIFVRTKNV